MALAMTSCGTKAGSLKYAPLNNYRQSSSVIVRLNDIVSRTMLTLLTFQVLACWLPVSTGPPLDLQPLTGPSDIESPYYIEVEQPEPPNLARIGSFAWQQPWSATSQVTRPERGVYNLCDITYNSGLDIVSRTMLTLLTFQVSYLNRAKQDRSSNRCVIAVSCPIALYFHCIERACYQMFALSLLSQLLLLLSGDVELNPGPTKEIAAILITIKELQEEQTSIREEFQELKEAYKAHEDILSTLSSRVFKLEVFHEHPDTAPITVESGSLKQDIAALKAASADVSNQLRRNNLIFLGIDDNDKETWKDSEDKVLAFCKEKLSFEIFLNSIERAHRIGTPSPGKKRPIIVNFMNFKTKEEIFSLRP